MELNFSENEFLFWRKCRSCFTSPLLIFSLLPCHVSSLQQQSCSGTITQCVMMRNVVVGKLLYRWWRIHSSVVSQFPSPPCGFCQITHFTPVYLFSTLHIPPAQRSISSAVTMSFCRLHDTAGLQVWMISRLDIALRWLTIQPFLVGLCWTNHSVHKYLYVGREMPSLAALLWANLLIVC